MLTAICSVDCRRARQTFEWSPRGACARVGLACGQSQRPTTGEAHSKTRERLTTGIALAVKWPGTTVK